MDDVIGQIESPFYVGRIFPNLDLEKINVLKGATIYYAKTKGKIINKNILKNFRGCDASNAFDEELPEEEMEFSDDEKESQIKKGNKKRKNNKKQRVDSEEDEEEGYLADSAKKMKEKYLFNQKSNVEANATIFNPKPYAENNYNMFNNPYNYNPQNKGCYSAEYKLPIQQNNNYFVPFPTNQFQMNSYNPNIIPNPFQFFPNNQPMSGPLNFNFNGTTPINPFNPPTILKDPRYNNNTK